MSVLVPVVSSSHVTKKIAAVETLVSEAWVRLLAARDMVHLSEQRGEDLFVFDEKDDLEELTVGVEKLMDRMKARRHA